MAKIYDMRGNQMANQQTEADAAMDFAMDAVDNLISILEKNPAALFDSQVDFYLMAQKMNLGLIILTRAFLEHEKDASQVH